MLGLPLGLIGPQRRQGPSFDTLLSVSFDPGPAGGTVIRLVHERLGELAAAMPHIAGSVGPGWEAVLTKLEQVLAETSPAGAVTR